MADLSVDGSIVPQPPRGGLDHLTITAADFAIALAFYDAALTALGLQRTVELLDEEDPDTPLEAAGWGPPDAPEHLWLVTGTPPTVGAHVRFRADSRARVERFHAAALAAGGADHAAPRRWTIYRTGEFNAIVADPAGNLVEAVAPE